MVPAVGSEVGVSYITSPNPLKRHEFKKARARLAGLIGCHATETNLPQLATKSEFMRLGSVHVWQ